MTDKTDPSVNAGIARAPFPVIRTLEEFDFTFQPGQSAVRVRELANLAFLDHATNMLFIGGPWRRQDASGDQSRPESVRGQTECVVQFRSGPAG